MNCTGNISDVLTDHEHGSVRGHGSGPDPDPDPDPEQDIEDVLSHGNDSRYDFDEKPSEPTDHSMLSVNTDLAQMFEDHYKDAVVDNPYHKIDKNISARMNQNNDPETITPPVHTNSAKIDMVILRAYTINVLDEIEKILGNSSFSSFGKKEFDVIIRKISKKYGMIFKKMDLYYMYCIICREKDSKPCDTIRGILQTNSFRSQSGVIVYAVFTHPFFKYSANEKFLQTSSDLPQLNQSPNQYHLW